MIEEIIETIHEAQRAEEGPVPQENDGDHQEEGLLIIGHTTGTRELPMTTKEEMIGLMAGQRSLGAQLHPTVAAGEMMI